MKTRRNSLEHITNELWPVFYGHGHVSAEDEVKGIPIAPFTLNIVHLKFDVWRDPFR
jgi:hypothetical protein